MHELGLSLKHFLRSVVVCLKKQASIQKCTWSVKVKLSVSCFICFVCNVKKRINRVLMLLL